MLSLAIGLLGSRWFMGWRAEGIVGLTVDSVDAHAGCDLVAAGAA
jgi:hypothetical protein